MPRCGGGETLPLGAKEAWQRAHNGEICGEENIHFIATVLVQPAADVPLLKSNSNNNCSILQFTTPCI